MTNMIRRGTAFWKWSCLWSEYGQGTQYQEGCLQNCLDTCIWVQDNSSVLLQYSFFSEWMSQELHTSFIRIYDRRTVQICQDIKQLDLGGTAERYLVTWPTPQDVLLCNVQWANHSNWTWLDPVSLANTLFHICSCNRHHQSCVSARLTQDTKAHTCTSGKHACPYLLHPQRKQLPEHHLLDAHPALPPTHSAALS